MSKEEEEEVGPNDEKSGDTKSLDPPEPPPPPSNSNANGGRVSTLKIGLAGKYKYFSISPSNILYTISVYGKARYSQIRRYSQIQNGLARPFNRTREGGFYFEGGG